MCSGHTIKLIDNFDAKTAADAMAEEAGAGSFMPKCAIQALEQAEESGFADRAVSKMGGLFAGRFAGGRNA